MGEGAFGVVYACVKKSTGEDVAVKMVDKVESPLQEIKKEAEMLRKLNHSNVVRFHDVFFEKCFVCIVMDKYSGGDLVDGLHAYMRDNGKIPCKSITHVVRQMADAICYLHENSVVHRDVKGDNFLMDRKNIVDPDCKIVLTDFGTAVDIDSETRLSTPCGTKIFWSPEFCDKNYQCKVDVWAMGVTVYGLVDGRFPFKDCHDIKKKALRIPTNLTQSCEDMLRGMLNKEEKRRLTAKECLNHVFVLQGGTEQINKAEDGKNPNQTDEDGGDAVAHDQLKNENIGERRREVLDRMNEAHQKRDGKKKEKADAHYLMKWFTIVNKHAPQSTIKYEWWDESKITQYKIMAFEGNLVEAGSDRSNDNTKAIGLMLKDHNIDIDQFGKENFKTLDQLAGEIQSGATRLMLDASSHKKLVRVVDVVLVRLVSGGDKNAKMLIETQEEFPDKRTRAIPRLPGTKKEPYENSKETAQRIIKESLNMADCQIQLDFNDMDVFEEEMDSPSYPKLRTVYRKEVVSGILKTTDPAILKRVKIDGKASFTSKDAKNYTKTLQWMTEKQAIKLDVKIKQDEKEKDVSALMQAPIGMGEEELEKYLQEHEVDTTKFGSNNIASIKEFSSELTKGESTLMTDAKGQLVRLVDLVVLVITNPKSKEVLVQTVQTFPDQTKNQLNRLPGTKRRPDENYFLTARRIIKGQLKIDDNVLTIDKNNVSFYEDEKKSQKYPMVRTLYRKCVMNAQLVFGDGPGS